MSRVAIITGAARGLGLACARRLGRDGARLGLIDVDGDALGEAASLLDADGCTTRAVVTDIRTRAGCQDAVDTIVAEWARVDILVNAAGVYPRVPALEITEEQWRHDFDVNVLGTYFMMVAAIDAMRSRGHIVNVSSIDAYVPNPENAHYAATKAAVVSLTRSIALEVAPQGILVNGVAPGPMATERAKLTDWYEPMVAALPTQAPIEPGEVAEAVAYLCREDNTSISGETIIISGGAVTA